MALEKASITPARGQPIVVLFNPTQYSLDDGNQFAEVGIPGLGAPIVQFVRGSSRTLSVDLFFDTYERRADVRNYTGPIYRLLEIDSNTHAPPICTFSWGRLSLRCVLERVNGRFTLFRADGTPVRATLTCTFREYTDVQVEVRAIPLQSADHTKTRTVRRGDTLSSIAAAEYDDPTRWRPIAEANRIGNPRRLPPGQVLVIPPLV